MELIVFDQSPACDGRGGGDSIRETLALADAAEALGYDRYWVSEHHGQPSLAGSAPEVLATALAARTRRMRVGTAGVLLPYHAPLKVAEQFRVLHAVAPGRIDLGIGRAPGGQGQADALAAALRPHGQPHAAALRDLLHWLHDRPDPPHGLRALPADAGAPQVWVLGGSCNGARLAAELGLPFAFNASNGVLPDGLDAPLELYRKHFRPSPLHPRPFAAVQLFALAAPTAAEAWRAFGSRALWRKRLTRGERVPLASAADAAALLTPADLAAAAERHVVGDAATVAGELRAWAGRLEADALAINTWAHDPALRRRSYALLASALRPRSVVDTARAA